MEEKARAPLFCMVLHAAYLADGAADRGGEKRPFDLTMCAWFRILDLRLARSENKG
jgi:hypothetical protein